MTKEHRIIKRWLLFFIAALFLSGLSAIPTETELDFLTRLFPPNTETGRWIDKIYSGVAVTNADYPFIAYGYDWLAFAHFTLAILFIGPYMDPIRNKWVIECGLLFCLLVIPFAWIAGYFRSIPPAWRLLDCLFGIIGLVPLLICYRKIATMEKIKTQNLADEN